MREGRRKKEGKEEGREGDRRGDLGYGSYTTTHPLPLNRQMSEGLERVASCPPVSGPDLS